MEHKERLQLLMQAKLNGLKLKDISSKLGCSTAWVSYYFSNKNNLSETHEQQLIEFINSYNK